jgi:hypothetical protein
MNRLRHSHPALRGLLLALALLGWVAVRSLAPTGFMPEWSAAGLQIVACPDYSYPAPTHAMPAMTHGDAHHSGNHEKAGTHESCPYAAATAFHALGADGPPFLADQVAAAIAPQSRPLATLPAVPRRDRPPSQGPPTPV